jgi:simple sugar transport system ATP-binding protein
LDVHRRADEPLSAPALSLEHIARRFGATEALVDASLDVRSRTVHALLGENGAGKTTLMRIAFGMLRPDAGTVRIDGAPVALPSPTAALRHGIGMVHQHFTFVPAMTVAENVALGGRGRYRAAAARDRVRAVSEELGFALDPDARAGDLPVGAQQRLEIVKAIAQGARILILDEPTAVLAPSEADELLRTLRRFAEGDKGSNRGSAVVIITHKLREAIGAADAVTVLRRGRTVLTSPIEHVSIESLTQAMIGTAAAEPPRRTPSTPRGVVATATDIVVSDAHHVASGAPLVAPASLPRVRGVTLRIHGGEIVGLAGVEGAGQYELLRALAGRLAPISGTLELPDRIGFVPEDRHRDALVLELPLYENIALRGAGRARGKVPWPAMIQATDTLLTQFDIRAGSARDPAAALSGGNQQKLVLARELDGAPPLLVAENPTRGLDIAATAAVQQRLLAARDAGMAVVVYSSDLDEVLTLADRLIVMYEGRAREIPVDRDAAGRAMLGVT